MQMAEQRFDDIGNFRIVEHEAKHHADQIDGVCIVFRQLMACIGVSVLAELREQLLLDSGNRRRLLQRSAAETLLQRGKNQRVIVGAEVFSGTVAPRLQAAVTDTGERLQPRTARRDRKSTRLNSSHVKISYA